MSEHPSTRMAQSPGEPQLPADFSFQPLTPTAFLERSAIIHRDRLAVVDGALQLTYRELRERACRLAGALEGLGVGPGGRVAVLAANSHLMLEAHYGVPLARGVLVALNMRLSSAELGYILDHSGASVLLCDSELEPLAQNASASSAGSATLVSPVEYERLLQESPEVWRYVTDERELLAINYTSGTTGRPKGVMYHHRGAYLQSLAMAFHTQLGPGSAFLWTLPMFHCNGWCFTWAVTAAGALHLCLPRPDPAAIWRLIDEAGVTHFNAAPTVLIDLASHPAAHRPRRPIRIATGGAPPSPALVARFAELGIEITHLYGLTESFGPVMICDWKPEWDELPVAPCAAESATRRRQRHRPGRASRGRRRQRRPGRRRDARRDRAARQRPDAGLLPRPGGDGGCNPRRLVSHRRPRCDASGRLRRASRP